MAEFLWDEKRGRDYEGDAFDVWVLFDGSGRILAKLQCPRNSDEFVHRVIFYLGPEMDKDEYQFVNLESAKLFAEQTVASTLASKVKKTSASAAVKETQQVSI